MLMLTASYSTSLLIKKAIRKLILNQPFVATDASTHGNAKVFFQNCFLLHNYQNYEPLPARLEVAVKLCGKM